ncbi:MAG: hypothetical protein HY669_01100 [Chloroflexi bacterium]|nr:hypothetical protein [Chloroflexota bacterium]
MAKQLSCPCGFSITAEQEEPLLNALQCHMTWHGMVPTQEAIAQASRDIKNV